MQAAWCGGTFRFAKRTWFRRLVRCEPDRSIESQPKEAAMLRNGLVIVLSVGIVLTGLMSPVSAATTKKVSAAAAAAARQAALVQAQKRKHKHHHHKKNGTTAALVK